jgi:integrase
MNRKLKIRAALLLAGVLAAIASASGALSTASAKSLAPAPISPDAVLTWNTFTHRALTQLAATTGCRQGELLALRWCDWKALDNELHIVRTYVARIGFQELTKNRKDRTVDLIPDAQTVLERWLIESGADMHSDALIFPGDGGEAVPMDGSSVTRVLKTAMRRGGVPVKGEHGRSRNFHSLRHSYSRVALQTGAPITWVSQQLGHSNITLTVNLYGRWERKAEKAQAAKLAGAFSL